MHALNLHYLFRSSPFPRPKNYSPKCSLNPNSMEFRNFPHVQGSFTLMLAYSAMVRSDGRGLFRCDNEYKPLSMRTLPAVSKYDYHHLVNNTERRTSDVGYTIRAVGCQVRFPLF